ncbi:MAG: hypothetical protein ACYTF3_11435 [Planctomycetota bacterium]
MQRLEMIQALQAIQAGQAAMLKQMQQQTASLKQLEKIDGAILRLVHGELQPKPVDPHGGMSTPNPPPVLGTGPR